LKVAAEEVTASTLYERKFEEARLKLVEIHGEEGVVSFKKLEGLEGGTEFYFPNWTEDGRPWYSSYKVAWILTLVGAGWLLRIVLNWKFIALEFKIKKHIHS